MTPSRTALLAAFAPPRVAVAILGLGLALGCSDSSEPLTDPPDAPPPAASGEAPPAADPLEVPALEPWGPVSDSRPNVWLITVDTLRADHLGCYGYARDTSPVLDALAGSGVRFDQAKVQWPKTGPSIASLLSSTYGSSSGVMRTTAQKRIPDVYAMLAEILEIEGGYECMGVVTNISLSPQLQYDQGFDRYEMLLGGNKADARPVYDKARQMLEERDQTDAPFFLWTHLIDPHSPYKTPDRYREMFVGDALYEADQRPDAPLDPNIEKIKGRGDGPQIDVGCIPRRAYLQEFGGSVRDYVVEYDAEIRYGDDELGRFMDWMREQGQLDDTLIVYTSDHGESLGDHEYYFAHGRFPYDACTRVPLIVHHPRIPAQVVTEPVALLDVAPTILDAVGLEAGLQMEGHSFLRRLMDPESDSLDRRYVFTESGYEDDYTLALHHGRHKLIKINGAPLREQLRGSTYELYDVIADPGETVDLVETETAVFEQMRTLLDTYQAVAYARVPPPTAKRSEMSAEEIALLAELGYTAEGTMGEADSGSPPSEGDPPSDPENGTDGED